MFYTICLAFAILVVLLLLINCSLSIKNSKNHPAESTKSNNNPDESDLISDEKRKYLKKRLEEVKREISKQEGIIDSLALVKKSSPEITEKIKIANKKYEQLKDEEYKIKNLL